MNSRTILTLVAIGLVILGLAGLVTFSQIQNQRATRPIWVVNAQVSAGDTFTTSNVQQIKVPGSADLFTVYTGSPIGKHSALALSPGHPITSEDVVNFDLSEVLVEVKSPIPWPIGDTIDVYALYNGSTVVIGKHLIVKHLDPVTVLVPTTDEPVWVALQANNIALFAAKSNGVGVPTTNLSAADAINQLTHNPVPSPSPGASPSPSPSPSP